MNDERADMLAAVERSPEAAGTHDRDGWVALYAADGRIEDPVGSRPHRGSVEIERFYDTFIGPRDIVFHRDLDIVVGQTVIRDLELEVTMAGALTMRIPAYLRYDLVRRDNQLKIAALYAFWELPAMVGQFLRSGIRAIPAGFALTQALLRNQGLAGAVGFLGGFRGVGKLRKQRTARFLDAACAGDEIGMRRGLAGGAVITHGDDVPLAAADLLTYLAGARWEKLIGAGNTLVAGVERDGRRAVLVVESDTAPFSITRIRRFAD